jgi:hypothetical protein
MRWLDGNWFVPNENDTGTAVTTQSFIHAAASGGDSWKTSAAGHYTIALDTESLTVTFTPIPWVDSVTITPASASVIAGGTKQFAAQAVASGGASGTVSWAVTGNTSTSTTIDTDGLLSVAVDESAVSLTVKANSAQADFTNVYGEVTVIISGGALVQLNIVDLGGSLGLEDGSGGTLSDLLPIYKSKAGGVAADDADRKLTITVTNTEYTYSWEVDGALKGSGNTLNIDAADYTQGGHTILLIATTSGVPWSKTISFSVEKVKP